MYEEPRAPDMKQSVLQIPRSKAAATGLILCISTNLVYVIYITPIVRGMSPSPLSPEAWMGHMASLLVHRCAQRADACGLDPRHHLSDINWSKMVDGLLRPQDMHLIWYYIRREVSYQGIPYTPLSQATDRQEIFLTARAC